MVAPGCAGAATAATAAAAAGGAGAAGAAAATAAAAAADATAAAAGVPHKGELLLTGKLRLISPPVGFSSIFFDQAVPYYSHLHLHR